MKKLLLIVLALTLMLACVSCGEDYKTLETFISAVEATSPKGMVLEIEQETALGTLNATVMVAYNEDGSSVIEYSYEKFNAIGEGDGVKSTVTGKITCDKDGNYTGDLTGKVESAAALKLSLDADKMKNLKFNDNMFSAIIESADTEAVLGVEIASDVSLVVAKAADKISTVTMTYTTEAGDVTVKCSYNN